MPFRRSRPNGPLRAPEALARATTGVCLLGLLAACGPSDDAEAIIERAIRTHGFEVLEDARVSFDFRGDRFIRTEKDGWFRLERIRQEDGVETRDVMTNDGSFREVDGEPVPLSEDERAGLETGVNSVIYFAFLPYRLLDPAVVARTLAEETVHGEPYHKVEVTFEREGGGRDWEDRFVYWFHRDEGTLDYLAYLYHTGGGGTRFRRAMNRRRVDGLLIQDHENFASPGSEEIEAYARAYEAGELEWVSDIELENIRVERPPEGFPNDPAAPTRPSGG